MTSFAIEAPVSVGWIGTGRLARALATRAHDAGVRTVAVANRSAAPAAWLAQATGAKAVDAQGVADAADWVFVTVPDDAIPAVVGNVRWRPGQLVLHCSGAGERNLLDAARQAGAETASFHPLFLFAG
uniref:NAD(P)-binding domain-containing protein n=1 Tax=Ralstonia sp. TaxID=54061 RepID=UPI0031D67E43